MEYLYTPMCYHPHYAFGITKQTVFAKEMLTDRWEAIREILYKLNFQW
jgi:hypothetical protein